jgi:hypothetical protein
VVVFVLNCSARAGAGAGAWWRRDGGVMEVE